MAHIQVIVGSTRPGRVGRKIADWYVDGLTLPAGSTIEVIDLAEENLPFLDEAMPAMYGQYANDHTKAWAEKIAKADGFVWVTPEYNHAPSPALLNAISFLKAEWAYKPVAFVGYGTVGAARAIEHLVSVASELSMVPLRERVWVNEPWANVSEAGDVNTDAVKGGDSTGQVAELVKWADATKVLRG
ncbi:MAG: NAD(P)H-dependent oxidoreductase [Candidatus Saccharimonadales bacterium]